MGSARQDLQGGWEGDNIMGGVEESKEGDGSEIKKKKREVKKKRKSEREGKKEI